MSDMDDKLRSAYARLPREEPPASLDAAILEASRRALAPRRSSRRWAVPLSVAAVLVLAFGIAIHRDEYPTSIEETKIALPETPADASAAPPPDAAKLEAPSQPAPAATPATPAAKPDGERAKKKIASAAALHDQRASEEARPRSEAKPERKDLAFAPEPQAPAPAQAQSQAQAVQKEAANVAPMAAAPMQAPAARMQAPAAVAGAAAVDDITRELDTIARLRAERRDDEADKALEAFRRKHPDYRIPDAVWERVKPR